MGTLVMINGEIRRPEDAKISVFDRGLLYGDSVFETIGTYSGRPFALREHLQRLRRSAELVHIVVPVDDDEFRQEVQQAIDCSGNPESYVRMIVTRGSGEMGLDPALAVAPQRIVIVTPLHRPQPIAYAEGVKGITYKTQRTTDHTPAVGAKVGNYLPMVLAVEAAAHASANEALIVDRDGRVVEGATSNVFVVKDGRLLTPPAEAGILLGITRAVVLRAAAREGLEVEYRCPLVSEVLSADEVFVTSSIRQLLALVEIDGQSIGGHVPGPVYRRLFKAFREMVEAEIAGAPPTGTGSGALY